MKKKEEEIQGKGSKREKRGLRIEQEGIRGS